MSWFKKAFEIKRRTPSQLNEQEQALVEKLARKVINHQMAVPAVMFLESVKPLSFLSGQVMIFFRPFISTFFDTREYDLLSSMLEDPNTVETLLNKIEALEQRPAQGDAHPHES